VTTRKVEDPEAADRVRLTQARNLSLELQRAAETIGGASSTLTAFRVLHDQQIAQFARSAGVSAAPLPTSGAPSLLTLKELPDRERILAQAFRGLALGAQRGDVAALLASAAAGIDQVLAR
jgi:hypothetical protein